MAVVEQHPDLGQLRRDCALVGLLLDEHRRCPGRAGRGASSRRPSRMNGSSSSRRTARIVTRPCSSRATIAGGTGGGGPSIVRVLPISGVPRSTKGELGVGNPRTEGAQAQTPGQHNAGAAHGVRGGRGYSARRAVTIRSGLVDLVRTAASPSNAIRIRTADAPSGWKANPPRWMRRRASPSARRIRIWPFRSFSETSRNSSSPVPKSYRPRNPIPVGFGHRDVLWAVVGAADRFQVLERPARPSRRRSARGPAA